MGLLNDKVTERRNQLTAALNKRGIYQSSDGRYLSGLSTYDLEMMNIAVINEEMREELDECLRKKENQSSSNLSL